MELIILIGKSSNLYGPFPSISHSYLCWRVRDQKYHGRFPLKYVTLTGWFYIGFLFIRAIDLSIYLSIYLYISCHINLFWQDDLVSNVFHDWVWYIKHPLKPWDMICQELDSRSITWENSENWLGRLGEPSPKLACFWFDNYPLAN